MQPFFSTKDPDKGTGLGLSISQSLVRRHRGSLYYDDRFENTTFVLELPIKQDSL
jgi:two-component system NtrC family sensor kinase